MSVDTKRALDEAIAAHISNECDGSIVTGYVLHASHLNADLDSRDATGYYAEYANNQAFHVGLGLAQMMRDHFNDIWNNEDEDDDL